jgi:hypothetical protein
MNHLHTLAVLAAAPNLSVDKAKQSALMIITALICISLAWMTLKVIWRDTDDGDYSSVAKKVLTSIIGMIPFVMAGSLAIAQGWATALLELFTSLFSK